MENEAEKQDGEAAAWGPGRAVSPGPGLWQEPQEGWGQGTSVAKTGSGGGIEGRIKDDPEVSDYGYGVERPAKRKKSKRHKVC